MSESQEFMLKWSGELFYLMSSQYSIYGQKQVSVDKVCEKHPWKNEILRKRDFTHIWLVKRNNLVCP